MPCIFYTLVIRNRALIAKHKKGLRGFLENERAARCNPHLTVGCYPDRIDTIEAEQDLMNNGLKKGNDYIIFEADNYASALGSYPRKKEIHLDVDMGIAWLKGEYTDWGIDVWHVDVAR